MLSLSTEDLQLLQSKDISIEQIENQLNSFKNGFPYAHLVAAATLQNGIKKMSPEELKNNIHYYNIQLLKNDIIKFVPASGAASRMFKSLFEFQNALDDNSYEFLEKEEKYSDAIFFFDNLNHFAFYNDLKPCINKGNSTTKTAFARQVLECLLSDKGLNYANLPKGLLKFHKYPNGDRMAIEEHLVEAAQYANSKTTQAKLHFTISVEHEDKFKLAFKRLIPLYENKFNISYDISYSFQEPFTDTIAVDMNNVPLRDNNGKLLFRPGGHGALINNLNKLNADLIFIKNIDNVVSDNKRQSTIDYKKALGGMGFKLNNTIHELVQKLTQGKAIDEAYHFATDILDLQLSSYYPKMNSAEKADYLFKLLNRPLRICGVVKNVGEPGGGPFWVKKGETTSRQIVESAEIDQQSPLQKKIMQEATHFNPVDLVCFTKDYQGNNFDLHNYVDHKAAFISEKSKDGIKLKAMELPGLWNGAMAFWNTLFVEVPLSTFNPVKTINDLLR